MTSTEVSDKNMFIISLTGALRSYDDRNFCYVYIFVTSNFYRAVNVKWLNDKQQAKSNLLHTLHALDFIVVIPLIKKPERIISTLPMCKIKPKGTWFM